MYIPGPIAFLLLEEKKEREREGVKAKEGSLLAVYSRSFSLNLSLSLSLTLSALLYFPFSELFCVKGINRERNEVGERKRRSVWKNVRAL